MAIIADKTPVIASDITIWTAKFANVWCHIRHIMSNCHLLEVVGRGSHTQLQVGENSNNLSRRFKY